MKKIWFVFVFFFVIDPTFLPFGLTPSYPHNWPERTLVPPFETLLCFSWKSTTHVVLCSPCTTVSHACLQLQGSTVEAQIALRLYLPHHTCITVEWRKFPCSVRNGTADYYPGGVSETVYMSTCTEFFSHTQSFCNENCQLLPLGDLWLNFKPAWQNTTPKTLIQCFAEKGEKIGGREKCLISHNC